MNDRTGDFVSVLADDQLSHRVSDDPEPLLGASRRGWYGDVFFDHVRGVLDPSPAPLVPGLPYLLVCHSRDFDWTAQHRTTVKELATAEALIAEAEALVASERGSGSSNIELWEVYGVRVIERRPRPRTQRLADGVDARLLEDIRNAPDDDGPRLVWADAIGGERGELVVIQLDLARGGLSARETIARRKRQRALLAKHGPAWSGLEGIARRVSFARGFVDAAEIPAPAFLEHADDIAAAAPLLSSLAATDLRADGPAADPIPLLSRLCADPVTRELRGLELAVDRDDELDDRTAGELAIEIAVRAGLLRQLRALGSRNVLRMPGIRTLINPRSLHEIERLWLGRVENADAVHALLTAGALPALRSLDLGARCPLAQVASLIPPTVTELFAGTAGDLAALAKTPLAATLEHLEIGDEVDLHALAAFPKLRSLYVGTIRSIARARDLPALRELAVVVPMRPETTRALVDELGPQLELLDLRVDPFALRYVNELKPKVAGELLVGNVGKTRRGLLRVGRTTQRAWWDHVTLE